MEKAVLEGHFVIIEHLIVGGAEGGAGMLHKITKPTASRGDSEVLEDVFHLKEPTFVSAQEWFNAMACFDSLSGHEGRDATSACLTGHKA